MRDVQPFRLPRAQAAWGTEHFNSEFKAELESLGHDELPLQKGVSRGSYASDEPFEVMILSVVDDSGSVRVRAGIHYRSLIAGCNCADDPTPVDTLPEYCEVEVTLDKDSGDAEILLLGD